MHPLGCNVYIIYGLCKQNLQIRLKVLWSFVLNIDDVGIIVSQTLWLP